MKQAYQNRRRNGAIVGLLVVVAMQCSMRIMQGAGIGDVFVIAMENHNFTQPASYTSTQAIYGNSHAPFINSLITPGNANAAQTAWASNYVGLGGSVHPSEPNYIWTDAGTNFGVTSDNNPFGSGGNEQYTDQHLTGLLQKTGMSWKSYQEDIDLNTSTGAVKPQNQWTVPLTSISGTMPSGAIVNPYNGSRQYNYAPKHNAPVFFNDTSGGNDSSTSNPQVAHYAPLQQLQTDLTNNTVAQFNWITPNQYNDMHSALSGGFTYHGTHYTSDSAQVAQGDNFLSIIVPQIEASQAYQNNGLILIWFDETEGGDTSDFTMPFIAISPLAKGNAYQSSVSFSHSSTLRTLQEVFQVAGDAPTGYLGSAANVADEASLFQLGTLLPLLPGDFNRDGHVDASDIASAMGALSDVTSYQNANGLIDANLFRVIADVNGDGSFTSADLQFLLNTLQTGGGSAEPVPEPAAAVLLAFCLPAALLAGHRRRKPLEQC